MAFLLAKNVLLPLELTVAAFVADLGILKSIDGHILGISLYEWSYENCRIFR